MRTSRLFIVFVGLVVVCVLGITAPQMRVINLASASTNSPPIADNNTFHIHGNAYVAPLTGDVDPDGDVMHVQIVTFPTHAVLEGVDGKIYFYRVNEYLGTDSFTYKACDPSNACSNVATVTVISENSPPVAGPDSYFVRNTTIIGPMKVNDYDPDNDGTDDLHLVGGGAAHGTVFGLPHPPYATDLKEYHPNVGYTGTDTFVYEICDPFNACGTATVTLFVLGDAENDGLAACNSRSGPVNVSNGNMFLPQGDHSITGVGPAISLTRTYNSNSQRTGLFGRGWSSDSDESVVAYDSNLARLNWPDGRAIYFSRPIGSTGELLPVEQDFHGSLAVSGRGGGFTLTTTDGSVHQFDAAGKLVSLDDRAGNQTTFAYDSGGKLTSETDQFGRVLSFTTNTNGQVLTIADTLGTIATYTYGANSRLVSVTYADNSSFTFTYDSNLRMLSATDALGNVVQANTYDGQGRTITSERQGGIEHYGYSYVSSTRTDVTDGLGHVTKYTIDKSNRRNVVTQVEGLCSCGGGGSQVQTWTYDAQLNVTAKTDSLNHTTTFTYDADGNRLTETDASGTVTYTYNAFGQMLTRTNQLSGVITNTFDSQGNPLTTQDPLNNTTTFTYDSHGQPLTRTDARGKVTTYTWDSSGRMTQAKDALNHTTDFAYDARARLTSVTNALNQTTSYEYDAAGRPKKTTFPDSTFVSYTYDLAGRRTKMTDPRGNETTFGYDSAYRLTSVTDAASHATTRGYDTMSKLTSVTDALSRVTNYEYDDFNRLKKMIYPPATTGATRLEETIEYDAGGNVTKKTDTAGRETTFAYDNLDRMTSSIDADGKTTSFEHDALSRTTIVVDALSQEYEIAYDAVSRQTGMTRGGVSMSYAYDAVGNRIERTDYNGATTNYTYDDVNRLTTIAYPDSTGSTYTYDALSRVATAVNENGTVSFTYDNRGRIASTTDVFNQTLTYAYDANGNRTAMTLNSSAYAGYSYDVLNRITELSDSSAVVSTYAYDAVSKPTSRTLVNGVVSTYEFDGLDRLKRLHDVKGATSIQDNQYSYNPAHQITEIAGLSETKAYEYDPVNRLTREASEAYQYFNYDAVGNRTSANFQDYSHDAFNRLTSVSGFANYTYDANGNQLSRGMGSAGATRTFDFENRLTQVDMVGSLGPHPHITTVAYKYDALGRRIERTHSAGEIQKFVYDGLNVVLDLDDEEDVVASYLNGLGIDNKIRQTDANGNLYFTTDHLGSTRALTDDSGNVVEQLDYDSFGNIIGGSSSYTRYTYTGREYDSATELYYYRARFYDPQIGRFISEDPIGLAGGVNQFTYVSNNPLNATDPSGLYEIDVHYYLTYYLARKTGCFTDEQARLIAEYDQLADDDNDHGPGPLRAQRNVDFHAFGTHEQNAARQNELWGLATQGYGSLSNLGIFMHFMQDSYSHYDFAGNPNIGHGKAGHSPDHTNGNPTKAMAMARKTWDFLNLFGWSKGLCCRPQEPDWNLVAAFANVGYDLSTRTGRLRDFKNEMSPAQLRLKIQILDVPWRSADGISRP